MTIKAGNKEYILKYTFKSFVTMQDIGINLTDEVNFNLKDIALLLQLGLEKYHKSTLDETYEIIDEILVYHTLEELMNIIGESVQGALGKK